MENMNKKRVLLIEPPFYRLMGSHFNSMCLGLCYIGAVLKEGGHEVKIYNADHLPKEDYANQRELFEHYDEYKKILNDPSHAIWKGIREKIAETKPDIVGISMLTATYRSAINIAKIVKNINKDTTVVVGGTHPTLLPEECAACGLREFCNGDCTRFRPARGGAPYAGKSEYCISLRMLLSHMSPRMTEIEERVRALGIPV